MARDRTALSKCARAAIDQSVADSLMVPLAVIVLDVLADDSPKMTFAADKRFKQRFRHHRYVAI